MLWPTGARSVRREAEQVQALHSMAEVQAFDAVEPNYNDQRRGVAAAHQQPPHEPQDIDSNDFAQRREFE